VRNKFLGTGEPGYHPLRKLRTIFAGLRYAVVYDFIIKDIAAAGVGIAMLAWLLVLGFEAGEMLRKLP